MFFKSKTDGGVGPCLDNDQSNKILLLMFGSLLLLIFMDYQAERHYNNLNGQPGERISKTPEKRLGEIKKRILMPVRRSAAEIFGAETSRSRTRAQSKAEREDTNESGYGADPDSVFNPNSAAPLLQGSVESMEYKTASLYFIRFQRSRTELVRVKRRIPAASFTPQGILELLQQGPLPRERGLLSAFNRKTNILDVQQQNDVILVDLGEGVAQNGPKIVQDRLDQIVLTLSQFPEIREVKILQNGRHVDRIGTVEVRYPKQRRIAEYKP